MMTLRIGNNLWVGALALSLWVSAPVWAEDDGGAPAPQPVVENPAAVQGVYDQQGNRLGANWEEAQVKIQAQAQAEHQAQVQAFQTTHPDPGDGSGFRDMQGNFIGRNTAEAAAAGFVADPTSPEEIKKEIDRHGTENIYFNPETGDWMHFGKNGRHGVTREEYFDDSDEKARNAEFRRHLNDGRGELGKGVDDQMDMTLAQHEQAEKERVEALAKEKERLEKLKPRTLVSVEHAQGGEQK